jgi:hypothetical protein
VSFRAQSQVQSSSAPSFTPAPVNNIQRKCACGGSAGFSGECDECKKKKLLGADTRLVQPKLKISQPNDKYEQEADRVADKVMRMPEPKVQRQVGLEEKEDEETIQTKSIANKIMPFVQRQVVDEEESIQTKATSNRIKPMISREVQFGIEDLKQNTGLPLPQKVKGFMAKRFGQDFSRVLIHTNRHAQTVAKHLKARAFTLGPHIAFGPGQFSPETTEGKMLLAHELTHVVQQSGHGTKQSASSDTSVQRKERDEDSTRAKPALKRWLKRIKEKVSAGRKLRPTLRRKKNAAQVFLLAEKTNLGVLVAFDGVTIDNETSKQLRIFIGHRSTTFENTQPIEIVGDAPSIDTESENEASTREATGSQLGKCPTSGLVGPYKSTDLAAKAFKERWNPVSIKSNQEVCSIIIDCVSKEKPSEPFYYVQPWGFADKEKGVHSCLAWPQFPPFNGRKPSNYAGALHTHGGPDSGFENDKFSGGQDGDRQICRQSGFPCYVATPSGCLLKNTGKGVVVLEGPLDVCDPNQKRRREAASKEAK